MSILTNKNSYTLTSALDSGSVNISTINTSSASASSATLNATNNASDGIASVTLNNSANGNAFFMGLSPYSPVVSFNAGSIGSQTLMDMYLDASRIDFFAKSNCYFFGYDASQMNTQFENQAGGNIVFTLVAYTGALAYMQYILLSESSWYTGANWNDNVYSIGQGTPGIGNYFWVDSGGITNAGSLKVNGAPVTSPDNTNIQVTGITFDGANILSDYETGTFNPTIEGATTAGTTTYVDQIGTYTRIGDRVLISAQIDWTAATGTGTLLLGSLPFVSNSVDVSIGAVSAVFALPSGCTYPTCQVIGNTVTAQITASNPVLGSEALVPVPTTGGTLRVTMQYFI